MLFPEDPFESINLCNFYKQHAFGSGNSIIMLADDTKLGKANKIETISRRLQGDITRLVEWEEAWQMWINEMCGELFCEHYTRKM